MASLPPAGDPRRPLQLAIRSIRLLGLIFTLIGFAASFALVGVGGRSHPSILMLASLFWLAPGVLYIVCAVFLAKKKSWAIILGIVLASIQGIGAVTVLVLSAIAGALPGVIGGLLWAAALAQLIYHLSQSFKSIQYDPPQVFGFQPIMPPPPLPPAPVQSVSDLPK